MDPSHFYPASLWAKMGIELTIDKVGGSEMKIKTANTTRVRHSLDKIVIIRNVS